MAAYEFKQGWYYMAGVDKPGIVSIDFVVDEVEDMGFKVLMIGECEKWGDGGVMPFPTAGKRCPDDYDWIGMVERVGPTQVIDLPSQVKWIKGWPKPNGNGPQPNGNGPQPNGNGPPPLLWDVSTWHLFLAPLSGEEPQFVGIFEGPKSSADVLAGRMSVHNDIAEHYLWLIAPETEMGFWDRMRMIFKTFMGLNTWYDVYWVPVHIPADPADMMLHKIYLGNMWTNEAGLNDFVCDMEQVLPRLVIRDYKNNRWVFGTGDLPRIHDTSSGLTSMVVGRFCR